MSENEHEQRLRKWIQSVSAGGGPLSLELAEKCLDAALSRARAEALNDAWRAVSGTRMGNASASEVRSMDVAAIRALITTPAPASIPVERVREVLREIRDVARSPGPIGITYARASGRLDAVGQAIAALGVDLDAQDECPVCEAPDGQSHKMSCRPQNREDATERCALCSEPRNKHDNRGRIVEALRAANGTQWGEVVRCHGFHLLVTPSATDTRQTCTCAGSCKGTAGLGVGWRCALERKP